MHQEAKLTREEKIAMYMTIDKRLLAEMLVEANDVIDIVAVNRGIIIEPTNETE